MTESDEAGANAPRRDEGRPPRVSRLKRRADFLRAARGRRARCASFALQANRRAAESDGFGARVGFTVTKKLGNAVVRNRIRRRLKAAVRLAANLETRSDHDYVVMAQPTALVRRFDLLVIDVERAFCGVHARGAPPVRLRRPEDRDEQQ